MLAEDARFAMPPLRELVPRPRGDPRVPRRLSRCPGSGAGGRVRSHANGQPAIAFYAWDDDAGAYLPFALNVLTFRGELISDVTAFVNRSIEPTEREAYHRWVDQPADAQRLLGTFERFGLPGNSSSRAWAGEDPNGPLHGRFLQQPRAPRAALTAAVSVSMS